MKFYQSVVIMALLGYQANAVALKFDQGEVSEFFAGEQKMSEKSDSQKEVKAAKDKLELDQLKIDTEASLKTVKEMEEIKRKSDTIVELHNQREKEALYNYDPVVIKQAE